MWDRAAARRCQGGHLRIGTYLLRIDEASQLLLYNCYSLHRTSISMITFINAVFSVVRVGARLHRYIAYFGKPGHDNQARQPG